MPLRILYLSRVRLNPYVRLLADGVQKADAGATTAIAPTLAWRTLLSPGHPHLVHLHWLELQYSYGHPPYRQAARSLRQLLLELRFAQRRGIRLVYTVHNLHHHDELYPDLNTAANDWIFAHADAIHVHDEATAAAVADQHGRTAGVYIVPHGHYLHAYPNDIDRQSARQRLQLAPDAFVYLCLGQMRPYKGLDQLIDAFLSLPADGNELVIAGQVGAGNQGGQAFVQHLRSLAHDHPGVRLFPTYIADEDLQVFFNAADACVFPYRRATTSGAALLAYSFGKPIIAPAIGPFPDLISGDSGVLFQPGNGDLRQALDQARRIDPERARTAALSLVASRDWASLGARHAALYRQITGKAAPSP
ncbi:MAG: glycosyltransferase family 4 protein [Caldilineales bacterium]|nr:glycosyltransferase family 4 protein [Caldilineales bacterium]